jgi:histidine triad (HIT) family protein
MEECIYCNITQESYHEIILSNDLCIYSLLKEQEIKGAGIIVPRSHRETVFDLTPEEWNATYALLHEVKKYIDINYKPDGYNVGWNSGEVAGQHIFHSHLHVIPRYSSEPLAGKGLRYLFKTQDSSWSKNT